MLSCDRVVTHEHGEEICLVVLHAHVTYNHLTSQRLGLSVYDWGQSICDYMNGSILVPFYIFFLS